MFFQYLPGVNLTPLSFEKTLFNNTIKQAEEPSILLAFLFTEQKCIHMYIITRFYDSNSTVVFGVNNLKSDVYYKNRKRSIFFSGSGLTDSPSEADLIIFKVVVVERRLTHRLIADCGLHVFVRLCAATEEF